MSVPYSVRTTRCYAVVLTWPRVLLGQSPILVCEAAALALQCVCCSGMGVLQGAEGTGTVKLLHGKLRVLKNDCAANQLLGAGIDDLIRKKKSEEFTKLRSIPSQPGEAMLCCCASAGCWALPEHLAWNLAKDL